MIKIITAIANPNISKELKKEKEIEIIGKDIQYEEGILEVIEKNKEIDYFIIHEEIIKNIKIIKQIKKEIKIILLITQKENKKEKNIINIKIEKNEPIKEVIKKIKEQIIPQNKIIEKQENRIITIVGAGGVGKSICCILLAIFLSRKYKIMILDFDILKQDLHTILGVNPSKQKINKKIDLLSDKKFFKENKIEKILEELKLKYDYILIDTSSQINFYPIKNMIENSEQIIVLMEPNLLEIKKAKNIIEKIKRKVKIIINKNTENSIDENIIKNIMKKNKIIGNIKWSKNYHILINKNFEESYITKEIKKEYIKIIKNIIEGEKNGNTKYKYNRKWNFCSKRKRAI